MSQTSFRENVISTVLIPLAKVKSHLGWKGAPCASSLATHGKDSIPYSAKELKYLWTMWDEAYRRQPPVRRYRNIYVWAVAVILAGGIISGMGQPFSVTLGGVLMLVGGLIGAWHWLKSLRCQRRGAPGK